MCLELRAGRVFLSLQDEEVILQNPADVPVFVQVLPLALLPNPSVFSGKLADRWGSLNNSSMLLLFIPSSSLERKRYNDLSLILIFQVAIRKFVQHQH